MSAQNKKLDSFHKAALSLKLFSRAELSDEKNRNLIEKLYVDPLPNDQVYKTLLASNTTILVGRKGTGKSTVFQRVQHEIRKNKIGAISAYMDIRNVFEESQVDPSTLERVNELDGAMNPEEIKKLLLYKKFLSKLIVDIKDELKSQIERSFLTKLKDRLYGDSSEVFSGLDAIINRIHSPDYEDIALFLRNNIKSSEANTDALSTHESLQLGVNAFGPNVSVEASNDFAKFKINSQEEAFSQILMKIIGVSDIINEIRQLLNKIEMKNLYIFLDDFSELPPDAMHLVVDSLISPLSRWSDFIKFKIAAYPGRVYLGAIDKQKIEEINLDIYGLYGAGSVTQMEDKATDFVKRLVIRRLEHFCKDNTSAYFSDISDDFWRILFFSSMANPRNLGHILLYSYESNLIYGKPIGIRAIQESSERYFNEKVLPFFGVGKFHLALNERSSIYSLKELLEKVVNRARTIRQEGTRGSDRHEIGTYSSHFYIGKDYDEIFKSLELAFFLTKYYEQSDREGKRVSVFALNYGLCTKYQISFGRPAAKRSDRLYFVNRTFDYNGIVREYISENQELKCNNCNSVFDSEMISSFKVWGMMCPECRIGRCEVINLSRKYEDVINSVSPDLLLPETELGILQTLKIENKPMVASEIAGELDCSGQLVGRRGRNLAKRKLVSRQYVGTVYAYNITEQAKTAYFKNHKEDDLDV